MCKDSEYVSGSECASLLDIPGIWVYLGFWICQGFEYGSGSKYEKVLNVLGLDRLLNKPEYGWIILKYVWIYLNIREYAGVCVNMPIWWLLFYISPLQSIINLKVWLLHFNVYMKLEVIAIFLTRQNLIFSLVARSIWFDFCFHK